MNRLKNLLIKSTNGRFEFINSKIQRLLVLTSLVILVFTSSYLLYTLSGTVKEIFIYHKDSQILSEIEHELNTRTDLYSSYDDPRSKGVQYFSADKSLIDKFGQLSWYNGSGFNVYDVRGNYERHSSYRTYPLWDFLKTDFIYCISAILLWWVLLAGSTWILYGENIDNSGQKNIQA